MGFSRAYLAGVLGALVLVNVDIFGLTESGTGVQVSLLGLFGVSLGLAEGVEVNLLGMTFGVDFWRPAIKLPFAGRFGFTDARVFE